MYHFLQLFTPSFAVSSPHYTIKERRQSDAVMEVIRYHFIYISANSCCWSGLTKERPD